MNIGTTSGKECDPVNTLQYPSELHFRLEKGAKIAASRNLFVQKNGWMTFARPECRRCSACGNSLVSRKADRWIYNSPPPTPSGLLS